MGRWATVTATTAVLATAYLTIIVLFVGFAAACGGGGGGECGFEKPSVTTEAATNISSNGAKLNGTVNPHGCETSYAFEWGTTESYGSSSGGSAGSGSSNVAKELVVAGTKGTTYHFRISATNINGTSHGSDKVYTLLAEKPAVTTEGTTAVTETSATLHGIINPNGSATSYYFKYGTTEAYGKKSGETITGSVDTNNNVAHGITGLVSKTKYHYRLVGTNGIGTTEGSDKTFTTP